MALVKAKVNVYLGENGGYKTPDDDPFEYPGPENHNLEYLDKPKNKPAGDYDAGDGGAYDGFSREGLKAELARRGIEFSANLGDLKLRQLLEANDAGK